MFPSPRRAKRSEPDFTRTTARCLLRGNTFVDETDRMTGILELRRGAREASSEELCKTASADGEGSRLGGIARKIVGCGVQDCVQLPGGKVTSSLGAAQTHPIPDHCHEVEVIVWKAGGRGPQTKSPGDLAKDWRSIANTPQGLGYGGREGCGGRRRPSPPGGALQGPSRPNMVFGRQCPRLWFRAAQLRVCIPVGLGPLRRVGPVQNSRWI